MLVRVDQSQSPVLRVARKQIVGRWAGRLVVAAALCGFALGLSQPAFSAPAISFQGYLTDDNGVPLPGPVDLTFGIYAHASGGVALWSETQGGVALSNGTYSVLLGSITPFGPDLFTADSLWIQTSVNGADLLPRRLIGDVPRAITAQHATIADSVVGWTQPSPSYWQAQGSTIHNTNAGNVGIGTSTPTTKLEVAGTARMSGFALSTGPATGRVLTSDATGTGTWQTPAVTRPLTPPVATSEIASSAVTAGQIASGVITDSHVSTSAGISDQKLAGTGTVVSNLNADLVDGLHASGLQTSVSRVIRGVINISCNATGTDFSTSFSPSIDPAKAEVFLSGPVVISSSCTSCWPSVMGEVIVVGLTSTSLTIGLPGDSGHFCPQRIGYQIVVFN